MQTHHCPGSVQLQWCHLQTSGVSQTGLLRCSHLCRGKRGVGREETPGGAASDYSCAGEDGLLTGGGHYFELDELLVEDVWVNRESPNTILAYIPGWSRCCRMKCSPKLTASSADLFAQ
ncbi:hypothetical protein AMECASPLE_001238 [Ameca splendens]|uniref:Uncharacterized protein n=1 Tax=Ameca splendens TaxID=208324 RepID=A0ABV0YW04_9TELE